MVQKRQKQIAIVQCSGESRAAEEVPRSTLSGDCRQTAEACPEERVLCKWGCLGDGRCTAACKLGAIFINDHGVAQVDREKCKGCGLCVKACPKGLIQMIAPEYTIFPHCASLDTGAETRKACRVGCIACRICEKNCPADAIKVVDNHAIINMDRCIACGMCAIKCPRGTILDADQIFTANA